MTLWNLKARHNFPEPSVGAETVERGRHERFSEKGLLLPRC